jgi:DNA-binding transcriptional MerR regulator
VSDEGEYGVEELAARAGVSRRTVRYYVQRGLLEAPTGLGRGKHYTAQHLAALIAIRDLQEAGVPLEEIGARLRGESPVAREPVALAQSAWTRVELAEGLELHVRDRRFSPAQLHALRHAIAGIIEGEQHD